MIDPQTPTTLYAGNEILGVFKSVDGGENWTPVNDGLTNLWITSLAIDPQTPSTLYAGTNDGAFVSLDGGLSWQAASEGLPDTPIVFSLAIDPQNPRRLYAGTYEQGLFRGLSSAPAPPAWNMYVPMLYTK